MLGWFSTISVLTRNGAMFHLWGCSSFGEVYEFTLRLPLSILNLLFDNPVLVVKIFILTTFLFTGVSMYVLAYHYTKKRMAGLFSSIIFMINQYCIGEWTSGHLNHAFAYAILPLLFLSFDKALKSGKLKSTIIFSATSALILLCRFELFAYCAPFLILYAVLIFLIPYDGIERKTVSIRIAKVALIGGTFVFLFSAFNFLPILLGARAGYISLRSGFTIEDSLWMSLGFFESLLGLARELSYLSHVGGIGWMSHPFLTLFQYWMAMAVLPILAFLAIIFRRDRQTLFFTSSALISVFLAKGPNPPFGEVFLWLYLNIPFFDLLHVPNRWLMITYLSYAFLAGISANAIYIKLQKSNLQLARIAPRHSFLGKIVRPIPSVLLISLIIPMSFGSWYAISNGLMTWHPPEQYINPHLWIATEPGNFRVATVPYYQRYAWTGGWWEHDLGYESSLFHNRPVAGIGGDPCAYDFVTYTYGLVLTNGTDNLMKILGAFNVKYLVVQGYLPTLELPRGYPPTYQHLFFSRQKGLQPVYTYENSTVYENEYWTPHIFSASSYAIVVGGREAFTALTTVESFDLSSWGLLFADQIADQSGVDQLLNLLEECPTLIFVNSEPLDLAMLTLKEAIKIRAVDYAYPSTDRLNHWISEDFYTQTGMPVLSRHLLSTWGNVSTSIPVNVETSGQYDVWIRVLHGPKRGNLNIAIDGTEIGDITPYARFYSGLKWIKIGSINLDQGKHGLILKNSQSTLEWAPGNRNDVDQIILVQPQQLESEAKKITELTHKKRIINTIEAEQMYKWGTTQHFVGWWPEEWPLNASNGYVAFTRLESWIPLKYPITRDGYYRIAIRVAVGPDYGALTMVIDNASTYVIKCDSQQTAFKWINIYPMPLQAGDHTLELYAKGKVELDQIVVYSLTSKEYARRLDKETTLDDVFRTEPQATVTYQMINPTKYIAHVKADAPFFLIFSEAYHPLWKAYIDGGEEIKSTIAYSFVNAFHITKTGEYNVTIEFIGQRYVTYGGIISITSITLTIIYLTFGKKINRFTAQKLKPKKKKEAIESVTHE